MKKLLTVVAVSAVLGLTPTGAAGQELGFGGTLGMEFTFTPLPPAGLDITADITLALSFGNAEVTNRTRLAWDGLREAWLGFGLDFSLLQVETAMRFDPCFSMYRLALRTTWCPVELGGLILVENLGVLCEEPPDYTVGLVLDLTFALESGYWLRSLTGFGVWDLYNLVDDDPRTDISAAPGWLFEEELLGMGFHSQCFLVDSWILFTDLGLSWARLGSAYRWSQPDIEVGARLWWSGGWLFDTAELFVAGTIDPVTLRSTTVFDLTGFLMQRIYVDVTFSGITIYAESVFDFIGLLKQIVGIELRF